MKTTRKVLVMEKKADGNKGSRLRLTYSYAEVLIRKVFNCLETSKGIIVKSLICSILVTSCCKDITNKKFRKTYTNCEDYTGKYCANVTDLHFNTTFKANFSITKEKNICKCRTDALPNHNFNDKDEPFKERVGEQDKIFYLDINPKVASKKTNLSLQYFDGILLNGALIDMLAAACCGYGDEIIGCGDDVPEAEWRKDPVYRDNNFKVDEYNAHGQPQQPPSPGAPAIYHYHKMPESLYDNLDAIKAKKIELPIVLGFAADGFPIFGPYFKDDKGIIRKAISSYQIKMGKRPRSSCPASSHEEYNYDGRYINDYRYIPNSGDLDECNGMEVNGQYGYFVTDDYPYIMKCFRGTPNESFKK